MKIFILTILCFGFLSASAATLSDVNTLATKVKTTPQETTVLSTVLSGKSVALKDFPNYLSVAKKLMSYKKLSQNDIKYIFTAHRRLSEIVQYFSNNVLTASVSI